MPFRNASTRTAAPSDVGGVRNPTLGIRAAGCASTRRPATTTTSTTVAVRPARALATRLDHRRASRGMVGALALQIWPRARLSRAAALEDRLGGDDAERGGRLGRRETTGTLTQ